MLLFCATRKQLVHINPEHAPEHLNKEYTRQLLTLLPAVWGVPTSCQPSWDKGHWGKYRSVTGDVVIKKRHSPSQGLIANIITGVTYKLTLLWPMVFMKTSQSKCHVLLFDSGVIMNLLNSCLLCLWWVRRSVVPSDVSYVVSSSCVEKHWEVR